MKVNKQQLKTFLELALLLIFVFTIGSDQFPFVTNAIIFLWLVSMLAGLADNIRYRSGLKKEEIRYATLHDGKGKYTQLGIGAFLFLLSMGCYIWVPAMDSYALAGVSIAVFISIMGILELPNGVLQLKKDKLMLSGVNGKIDRAALKSIEIEQDSIILVDQQNQVTRQTSLNLSPDTASKVEHFLRTHVPDNGIVKNKVT